MSMNKVLPIAVIVVIIGGIAIYAISPYFTESTIDEAIPEGAVIQPKIDDAMMMMTDEEEKMEVDDKYDGVMTDEEKMDMVRAYHTDDETKTDEEIMEMYDEMMDTYEENTDEKAEEMRMMEMMDDTMAGQMITDPSSEFEMTVMSYAGEFIGVNDGIHNAEGSAYTIPLEDGSSVLRLEDFRSTNGPGLYVYLSTDIRATDYLSLGKLKANQGNQNYVIPDGTDLNHYDKVLIWCEPFGVLFGSAELSTQ